MAWQEIAERIVGKIRAIVAASGGMAKMAAA